jgi:hypothetical protein
MILYRPTGIAELRLVAASGWTAWPPRLPDQPIFYPVLSLDYARRIARDWNTKDVSSGNIGFVTQFEIGDDFARQYPVQIAGGRAHQELWVPAEELAEFNRHIVGRIEVVECYPGPSFEGRIDHDRHLPTDWTGKPPNPPSTTNLSPSVRPCTIRELHSGFAQELEIALKAQSRVDLSVQIGELPIVRRCTCGDEDCAHFYTTQRQSGAFGPAHENFLLQTNSGMVVIDVVQGKIVAVEVLDRPDVKERLDRYLPLEAEATSNITSDDLA